MDEPTRGIDIGAKSEIHRLMSGLAQAGLAILMISSELPEIMGMSDRILVMREGTIVAEFARAGATQEAIAAAMMSAAAEPAPQALTARPQWRARPCRDAPRHRPAAQPAPGLRQPGDGAAPGAS